MEVDQDILPLIPKGTTLDVEQNIPQGKTLEVDKDTLPLNSQGKSLEVEQLTDWSETMGKVSSHNSTPTLNRPKESLNATQFTPKSEPARPVTRQHCSQCKNCLTYGDSVLNCRGPPTQSPNHKTRPRCRCCHNCLTYGDSVRNCKGLPSQTLKPTSTRPANTGAIPKGTTTANPTPLAPTSLEYQVKTTLTNNEPTYTNPDRALKHFCQKEQTSGSL